MHRCTSVHRLTSFCLAVLSSDTVCTHQCLVVRLYRITCTDQAATRFDRAETNSLTRPQQRQPVGFSRARKHPTADPFSCGSSATQVANGNDSNQNMATNVVNSDDRANEDTTREAVCLSCFPGSPSGTEEGLISCCNNPPVVSWMS